MLTPKQGGRRPYHSKDLSCHLGQSYLVAPQGGTTRSNQDKGEFVKKYVDPGGSYFRAHIFLSVSVYFSQEALYL